jgi:hypothetical protein
VLFYRAALPLSRPTLTYLTGLIRRHRAAIGSAWRKLNPGRQALLVVVYLRKGETFAEVAAGSGVWTAAAWRHVNEVMTRLAARAPKLGRALREAKNAGYAFVVIDGTLIPIDRVAADRPFYSGKHRMHGMNIQVITAPDGTIVWTSGALPGSVHDLKAARIWGLLRALEKSGLLVLADKGYIGAGQHVITPYRGRNKPEIAEDRQPLTRPPPRSRRTRQRPAQKLADPAKTTLLPTPRRPPRQSHPRPTNPRGHRMKKAHYVQAQIKPSNFPVTSGEDHPFRSRAHSRACGARAGCGRTRHIRAYGNAASATKAGFLQKGRKTPVFVRFSTVLGSRGSAGTVRDVRGFAVKFYTEEGNFDLVGTDRKPVSRTPSGA